MDRASASGAENPGSSPGGSTINFYPDDSGGNIHAINPPSLLKATGNGGKCGLGIAKEHAGITLEVEWVLNA